MYYTVSVNGKKVIQIVQILLIITMYFYTQCGQIIKLTLPVSSQIFQLRAISIFVLQLVFLISAIALVFKVKL